MSAGAPEIVLGVTASIGAYKAGDLVRRLKERGCAVTCVLTKEAQHFITPLSLQVLSERPVHTDLFSLHEDGVVHTKLADQAKLVLIAPATAHVLAKLAHGLADDLLTCVALATKAPVLIAPAMNVHMYRHPMVQDNIRRLKALGHRFVGPKIGPLACGYDAIGHLSDIDEIVSAAVSLVGVKSAPAPAAAKPRPPLSSGRGTPARATKRRR